MALHQGRWPLAPKVKRDLSDRIAGVFRRLTPRPEGVLERLSVELVDMDREF